MSGDPRASSRRLRGRRREVAATEKGAGRRESGAVTAETALALPALVIALGAVLGAGQVAVAKVQCLDAARAGARAAARGDSPAAISAAATGLAPRSGQVQVSAGGGYVRVRVNARVQLPLPGRPGLDVTGEARAAAERGSGSVLVLAAVSVVWLLATLLGLLGPVIAARHRAEAAADLAALAAAQYLMDPVSAASGSDPGACARAQRVAEVNGAGVQSCTANGMNVKVLTYIPLSGVLTVLGPATATARAGPAPKE